MLYLGFGCITFGIKALSLGLASTKHVIVEISLQLCFYKESEIEVKNPLPKQAELSQVRNSDPSTLHFFR